jgi:acyl carrier protein
MSNDISVEDRVKEIVTKYIKADDGSTPELTRETELQTVNLESLDLIEIIFEVEDEFDIDIEQDEKTAELKTLGDVLDWLTTNIEDQTA